MEDNVDTEAPYRAIECSAVPSGADRPLRRPRGPYLVALRFKGWMAPKGWTSGLPPISLVAAVAALVPLLVKRKLVQEKAERKAAR